MYGAGGQRPAALPLETLGKEGLRHGLHRGLGGHRDVQLREEGVQGTANRLLSQVRSSLGSRMDDVKSLVYD